MRISDWSADVCSSDLHSVLDFTGQQDAGEGLLVTSDYVTLREFAVENPKGDGIKSKGADNIVYYKVRVAWTGGALKIGRGTCRERVCQEAYISVVAVSLENKTPKAETCGVDRR